MKRFADLYRKLDQSTATLDKRAALIAYFREAPEPDAVWALWLLSGGKVGGAKRGKIAGSAELRAWIGAESGYPDWLVDDSYDQVGDLAETLTLLLDDPQPIDPRLDASQRNDPQLCDDDVALSEWIEQRLLPIAGKEVGVRRKVIVDAWHCLPFDQRLLFNKLLTGALRVGVSQRLVQQALAEMSGIDISRLAQRMLGAWTPQPQFLRDLLTVEELPGDRQQPYPFFLASPLESALRGDAPIEDGAATVALAGDPEAIERALGDIDGWQLEWKWDGIRLQLIRRDGEVALWSRGEERLDGRFPEIESAAARLPRDCVLDGELLAWREGDVPSPFTALQTRIQRLKPGSKTLKDTPVRVQVYDLLELDGEDLRERPLADRRAALEALIASTPSDPTLADSTLADARIVVSPRVHAGSWVEAAKLRDGARDRGVEGLMLKRLASPYQAGRRRGDWWKWKIDPLTIDAVLLYAQSGHGRRSTLYTDYTFGLWDGDTLVPVAKAYSGLDDKEILALDKWIRAHTLERFGPVRSVQAHHVFELGFEAVNKSARHKSGIAVRFPRILRWRKDKPFAEADRLDALRALAR